MPVIKRGESAKRYLQEWATDIRNAFGTVVGPLSVLVFLVLLVLVLPFPLWAAVRWTQHVFRVLDYLYAHPEAFRSKP
jgi:hypothetical protein